MTKKKQDHYPIGCKITGIRWLSSDEIVAEGWYESHVPAIQLDDGSVIYPSQDFEGNGGGALFGHSKEGVQFYVTPPNE